MRAELTFQSNLREEAWLCKVSNQVAVKLPKPSSSRKIPSKSVTLSGLVAKITRLSFVRN